MKTFGKMSIAFLYNDETETIANEPILELSKPEISMEVLQRVYVSLGMHLHIMSCKKRYGDDDSGEMRERHDELMDILENKK